MAVYNKKINIIKGSSKYNIELVSTLAEATPLTLCYYDGKIYYASLVPTNHGFATPLRVQNGGIYAVPIKNKIPHTNIYYTNVGNNTFTVPDKITRIVVTIIGGGGGGLDINGSNIPYNKFNIYTSNRYASGGDGGYSYIRGFNTWYIATGGKGGSATVNDWGESISYSDSGGAGGTPNGKAGGDTDGGAGWPLDNGSTYGTGGSTTHSSYYVDNGESGYWTKTLGGGGGSGGCLTATINTSPGTVFNIVVGARGGNGVQGAVKIEYGEGIEP